MFRNKNAYIKLFFSTPLIITAINYGNNYVASQVSAQKLVEDNYSPAIIAKKSRSSTRKSGGRSGGGSFKSKSQQRSSGSRSTTKNKSRSSSSSDRKDNNSNNDYNSDSIYDSRNNDSSGYNRTSSVRSYPRNATPMSRTTAIIVLGMVLLAIGGIIFIPLFIVLKFLISYFDKGNRQARQTQQEINNNQVTVSKIQVALSNCISIQQDLSELSLTANTETPGGLTKLMRDASLIVVRNSEAWTHVLSSSVSLDITQAESAFESLSLTERSKYSRETLSNIDGDIKRLKKQFNNDQNQNDFAQYVVVTLIFGTVDDRPLFDTINTKEQLETNLLKFAAMREDYLVKFELLWSPQTEGIYLTDEELLMQYTKMMPLI